MDNQDWLGNALGPDNSYGLSPDAYIGIGFSSGAILLVLCIAFFLLTIPIVMGTRKYKGVMVVAGANSMVMSAACHVSVSVAETERSSGGRPREASPSLTRNSSIFETVGGLTGPGRGEIEMENLLAPPPGYGLAAGAQKPSGIARGHDLGLGDADVSETLRKVHLSRQKIKWGVVRMPLEFQERFRGVDEEVEHLTFGVEEQDVTPPEELRWYA